VFKMWHRRDVKPLTGAVFCTTVGPGTNRFCWCAQQDVTTLKACASLSLCRAFSHCFLLLPTPSVVEYILFCCCSSVVMQIEELSYEIRQPLHSTVPVGGWLRIAVTNAVTAGEREKSVSCAKRLSAVRPVSRGKLIPPERQLHHRFHRQRFTMSTQRITATNEPATVHGDAIGLTTFT